MGCIKNKQIVTRCTSPITHTHTHASYIKTFPFYTTKLILVNELKNKNNTGQLTRYTTTTTTDHTTVLDDISHLRVLVAEDNLVNQEVISRMLKQEGITNLTMACNGAKAIDFVKESIENNENFDLIFMDVQMPEVDGLKATKMIRKNLQYNKPIIALTAFADESNVKECLNSGMSGFITKPISKTNIKKVLVEFLSNEVVTS